MSKTTLLAIFVCLTLLLLIMTKKDMNTATINPIKQTSTILAFGDSLTYGFGANPEFSYPKQLERKTALKVINAGINGEITQEGLMRLPSLLELHKPGLVILCHGGNDILQKRSTLELKNNLLSMIQIIQEKDIQILFVGVPEFSLFGFTTHEVYEEIADEKNLLYEGKILTKIEKDETLKSDYVHPNAKGYELMADAFIEILQLNP